MKCTYFNVLTNTNKHHNIIKYYMFLMDKIATSSLQMSNFKYI